MEQTKTKVRIKWELCTESEIGQFLNMLDKEQKAHPDMEIEVEISDCHG